MDCVKERACILQTVYHKNMFKNTIDFKINFIVKYMIFLKKIVVLTVWRTFFDHLKIFDHLALDILIFLQLGKGILKLLRVFLALNFFFMACGILIFV